MNKTAVLGALAVLAQLVNHKDLSLTTLVTIAQTPIQTCKTQGYNVSAHVIGRSGEVLVAMRGDDTGPHTLVNSFKKGIDRASGDFCKRSENEPHDWRHSSC